MAAYDEEYDKLTAEEREKRDKEAKERERIEQEALPYKWTQELGDVDIKIPVPKGTRAKNVVVVMHRKKLIVGLKGQEPIMEGELCQDIKVEDSTWTIEDQQLILIHLEKINKVQWWANVLSHHPTIDTRKIEPPNSKLSELDGETRGMVEKMMFDNQQKAMGKPSSDELQKMEVLKKFQAAHPELDFSNANIS